MKPRFEVTSYHICIPLTEAQWERLSEIDDSSRHDWPECYEEAFTDRMKLIGVGAVEHNGHFGRNLFIEIDDFDVAEEAVKLVDELLGS